MAGSINQNLVAAALDCCAGLATAGLGYRTDLTCSASLSCGVALQPLNLAGWRPHNLNKSMRFTVVFRIEERRSAAFHTSLYSGGSYLDGVRTS